ncbi:site-specific integrase [Sphingobacterium faecale]|uniref:Site-specific integrase n=1 Tax=Sphingobacterium faecale TaxID=2803775 RepID=A0ABS1R2A4_9SPHI|nr:site-specific integrase [Sphingobacterium faecale]MBL1408830.1 site-specific integrase [Sphingobacterium faecale]
MSSQVTVYIYARAAKANAAGQHPIYVRITIQGQRTEFSTKKFIHPTKWDQKTMKMKGNTEEARSINNYLDSIKNKLTQTQVVLEYQSTQITLDNFMNAYQGKSSQRERTLIPIFQDHNKKLKALIGTDYSEGTYERYETSLKHTQAYIKHQYGTDDIALNKIDHAFVTGYDFYLRTEKDCSNNTTVKYIKNFKKIIRICMANGWITQDPTLNYKVKLQEVERNILTQEELKTITAKSISIARLDNVRDIFLFSCFTGLAYIDVKQLTPDNLIKGIDGQLWIDTKRQKTNTPSRIPLLSTALDIIQKYQDHPKCNNENILLPVASNQKMNAYLKEIATICGIKKELTFHCARHTFATTVTLSNGVPIESVSKMLGHKSIRTTQHYAKITDSKVANDMDSLKAIIELQKNNAAKKSS